MKLHRIFGIILRYLYHFRHSFDRMADIFYWPAMDLVLWGLATTFVESRASGIPSAVVVVISGIVFWLIVWRGQYEISVNILEEVWNKNLINVFGSPLKFSEWVSAFLLLGVIKAALSFFFAIGIAALLYQLNLFSYGFHIVPFALLLIMTGWWVGFLVGGIILRFGSRIQTLAWGLVFVIAPFSGVYYPISTLPSWARQISAWIPSSYIFEGIREVIRTGAVDPRKLLMAFLLNVAYLSIALVFFRKGFDAVLDKGLVKVY